MADRTSSHESITEVVPKTLKTYLLDKMPDLRQVLIDFPDASTRIKLPCVSIVADDPDFKPTGVPYPNALPNSGSPNAPKIKKSKADIEWVVGEYEFTLQLDLWAGNKEELDDMYDQLFNVLNPHITPMGVCLKMDEYFGVICDYLYTKHTRSTSEQESQRDEWRITLSVLATCKAIRDRKEFIIERTGLETDIHTDVLVSGE